jgi:hypothetical protein
VRFITQLASDFAIFFTALVGARLAARYILSRAIDFSMTDLVEAAIAAALIAAGRALLGKRG